MSFTSPEIANIAAAMMREVTTHYDVERVAGFGIYRHWCVCTRYETRNATYRCDSLARFWFRRNAERFADQMRAGQ